MTKEQFLAGVPFNYFQNSSLRPYRFSARDCKEGFPIGLLLHRGFAEATIIRVTDKHVIAVAHVCYRTVTLRLDLKKLYV